VRQRVNATWHGTCVEGWNLISTAHDSTAQLRAWQGHHCRIPTKLCCAYGTSTTWHAMPASCCLLGMWSDCANVAPTMRGLQTMCITSLLPPVSLCAVFQKTSAPRTAAGCPITWLLHNRMAVSHWPVLVYFINRMAGECSLNEGRRVAAQPP
jgi:hypothetical protein